MARTVFPSTGAVPTGSPSFTRRFARPSSDTLLALRTKSVSVSSFVGAPPLPSAYGQSQTRSTPSTSLLQKSPRASTGDAKSWFTFRIIESFFHILQAPRVDGSRQNQSHKDFFLFQCSDHHVETWFEPFVLHKKNSNSHLYFITTHVHYLLYYFFEICWYFFTKSSQVCSSIAIFLRKVARNFSAT